MTRVSLLAAALFILPLATPAARADGDPEMGKHQFAPCSACHTVEQGGAAKLKALPEVHAVITAQSLIPSDQPAKVAILSDLNDLMSLSLDPVSVAPPPTN